MSIYNLALMYLRGEGVDQDHSLAFKYFLEATELGHKEAKSQLQKIRTHVTDDFVEYRVGAQVYAGNEWPVSHGVVSAECKGAIVEVFFVLRYFEEVPVELLEIVVKLLIKVWPNMSDVVFDHYLNNCEQLLKKKST